METILLLSIIFGEMWTIASQQPTYNWAWSGWFPNVSRRHLRGVATGTALTTSYVPTMRVTKTCD